MDQRKIDERKICDIALHERRLNFRGDFREALDPLVFGQRLRHLRRARGLTLEVLGDRVGKPAPYLSLLENGRREVRLSLIDALAGALDVPAADLLTGRATEPAGPARGRPPAGAGGPALPGPAPPVAQAVGAGPRRRPRARRHPVRTRCKQPGERPTGDTGGGPAGQRATSASRCGPRDNYFPEIEQAAARGAGGRRLRGQRRGGGADAHRPASATSASRSTGCRTCPSRRRPSPTCATGASTSTSATPCRRGPPARSCSRRWATSRSATPTRPTSASSSASGSRPTTSPGPCWRPEQPAVDLLATAAQGGRHLRRGPEADLLHLLRDGRAPAHQPGHAPLRHPRPLPALRRRRRDLEGVRERRRAVPDRRQRRDRGPAGRAASGAPGRRLRSLDRFAEHTPSTPTRPAGRFWCITHVEVEVETLPNEAVTIGTPGRGRPPLPGPRHVAPSRLPLPRR